MKLFNKTPEWGGNKVNFVDENNVLVGYDETPNCDEPVGWFVLDTIRPYRAGEEDTYQDNIKGESVEWDSYVFDRSFMWRLPSPKYTAGGIIIFKLISKKYKTMYLHLYNCHNGYYSHGFEVTDNGIVIIEGDL